MNIRKRIGSENIRSYFCLLYSNSAILLRCCSTVACWSLMISRCCVMIASLSSMDFPHQQFAGNVARCVSGLQKRGTLKTSAVIGCAVHPVTTTVETTDGCDPITANFATNTHREPT